MSLRSVCRRWWVTFLVREREPFEDIDFVRGAFQPLSETTITRDDLSICWHCGDLFLTSMEGVHVTKHDWRRQAYPVSMTRPVKIGGSWK